MIRILSFLSHCESHRNTPGHWGGPTRGLWAAYGPGWLWIESNTKSEIYLKHYEISLWLRVTVYLACGPRQLFFQCGPETPRGWTPLRLVLRLWKTKLEREVFYFLTLFFCSAPFMTYSNECGLEEPLLNSGKAQSAERDEKKRQINKTCIHYYLGHMFISLLIGNRQRKITWCMAMCFQRREEWVAFH